MQKFISAVVGLVLCATFANAASYTIDITNAGIGTNTSDAIPVHGYLDKIEISGIGSTATSSVTVATYNGTTAIETFVSALAVSATKVVRYRAIPDSNADTAYGVTNEFSSLSVPLEKAIIGGNVKINTINLHAAVTNVTRVTFFYDPITK